MTEFINTIPNDKTVKKLLQLHTSCRNKIVEKSIYRGPSPVAFKVENFYLKRLELNADGAIARFVRINSRSARQRNASR